ncbi:MULTISPECIES: hypothetical protein [Bacillus]|uniref:hypothetical protein n=1 Tax=Bacillus TaxID=1386 RepID=UPI001ABE62C4|nr:MULTISPECIES: hypothetical protein [Bacillus subtilis group]MCL9628374.1 hypothetical protein [Bacillus subtilis]QTG87167.1 hypothetical protein J4048_21120 [Bacillus amyloliquefaciens]
MLMLLTVFVHLIAISGAIGAGILFYSGISTQEELMLGKFRIQHEFVKRVRRIKDENEESKLEKILKDAGYPFGLNANRYTAIFIGLLLLIFFAYVGTPAVRGDGFNLFGLVSVVVLFLIGTPDIKYSGFNFLMKKVKELNQAKIQAEVFTFYELVLNELRLMENSRIQAYTMIRDLAPNFSKMAPSINMLLFNWNTVGHAAALDGWAREVGGEEARALASVFKTLDTVDRDTAIKSLEGQQEMFMKAQTENFRRRIKVKADLAKLPIMATFALLMANYLAVVVIMCLNLLNSNM